MHNTSCEILGWMNHKLETRLWGEIYNNLRYADDTTFMAESKEEPKSLLMRVKRRVKKLAQNSTFKNLRSWHPVPSLHANRRGKRESGDILFSWVPKSS